MRKLFYLAVAVLALGMTVPAMAAIDGSSHDFPLLAGGTCAQCHLPHGASTSAGRLWVTAPVSVNYNLATGSVTAPLCAYCHQDAGGKTSSFHTAGLDPASNTWVYGGATGLSHGVLMNEDAPNPREYVASGLPYQNDGAAIECTSCHDVHNDTNRPFLRANITVLCAGCHGDRMRNSGTSTWAEGAAALTLATPFTWGGGAAYGTTNPGSHPVGSDINGNNLGGNTPITIWPTMSVSTAGAVNGWSMGGHLDASGGVNCVTCHAVHGVKPDNDGLHTLAGRPGGNFLTIPQAMALFNDGGRSIFNGQGAYNALCEGCHVGTTPDAVYAATANDTTNDGTGPIARNPGGTAFGHPVDDMTVDQGLNWVTDGTAFPTNAQGAQNWPAGASIAAGKPNPRVICESCHAPHPAADFTGATPRQDVINGDVADYILRDSAAQICNGCHTAAVNGHHPTGITFNGAGVTYLNVVGDNTDVLSCGTCHGGGTGAHNWPSRAFVGLDPQWKPSNNGRSTDVAVERYNAQASLTCIECHLGADGLAANKAPTLHDGLNTNYTTTDEVAAAYPDRTSAPGNYSASHIIGLLGYRKIRNSGNIAGYWSSLGAVRNDGTTAFNPEADSWGTAGVAGASANGRSRFGGADAANAVLVCESCHELQPAKNSNFHLLLGDYFEDTVLDAVTERSRFCEGCHKPAGTHPQTGETVGRSGATLVTSGRSWLARPGTPDTNVVMGDNRISCDSCHQAHDAANLSGTFILDCVYTSLGNNGTHEALATAKAAPATATYTAAMIPSTFNGTGERHNKFCSECHPY